MKVLLADDNKILRDMLERFFDILGFNYDIVSNGLAAIYKATQNIYDICLMDVEMPILNGIEATKVMRDTLVYFPILGWSGNPRAKQNCLSFGMDDFLKKPCDINVLFKKIKELTVKSISLNLKDKNILIKKDMPMNQKHADELRELSKEGLIKMNLRGIGNSQDIIVHKNVPNKISEDFIRNGYELTTFIDRNKDKPGECHLYKSCSPLPTIYLTHEEYEQKIQAEDKKLLTSTELVQVSLKKKESE